MECNHTITFRVRSSRKWILIEFTIKLGGSLLYILLATFLQFLNIIKTLVVLSIGATVLI